MLFQLQLSFRAICGSAVPTQPRTPLGILRACSGVLGGGGEMGSEGKQLLGIRCLMCQGFSGTWEQSPLQAPAQTQWGGKCWLSLETHLRQVRVF